MTEKEIFNRDKMYNLYIFIAKTNITLSSSSLAFSIGFIKLGATAPICINYLVIGWGLLILSVVLSVSAIIQGIKIYSKYFSNLKNHGESNEFTDTSFLEKTINWSSFLSFASFILGIIMILFFVYANLTNKFLCVLC